MTRALTVLFWCITSAFAIAAVGYSLMAADGYDYWSPWFPDPGSAADIGMILADLSQMIAAILMMVSWILLSVWAVQTRDRIAATWRHSKVGVWLWWLVPVAMFWKPRDVYMELARASQLEDHGAVRRAVNQWWICLMLFFVANNLGWLEFGPTYLAGTAWAAAVLSAMAASCASRLLNRIDSSRVAPVAAPDYGNQPVPVTVESPLAPGWYNDPSGEVSHQAYWDGGRWTGATRPDPRAFPTRSVVAIESDPLRVALIIVGIAVTAALVGLGFVSGFEEAGQTVMALGTS